MQKPSPMTCATMFLLGLSLLATSFICTPAEALMIELEPDMFAVGTNVTNLFEGVTIQRISNYAGASSANLYNGIAPIISPAPISPTPIYSPVYVEEGGAWGPPTGTHTFGLFRRPSDAFACWSGVGCGGYPHGFSALMVQFDRPTNYFEIAGSWSDDEQYIYAFDSNGQFVGEHTSRYPLWHGAFDADVAQIGSVDRAPYIQTLFIGGWENPANLDRIRYNSVPEPSTLLLLGSGLAGLAGWRRKRPLNH